MSGASLKLIHVKSACEQCAVRKLCLPTSLEGLQLDEMDKLVHNRPPLQKGEYLYHVGDHFRGLFAIRQGALKTYGLTHDGKEQVTGFHLSGELVGLDAIDAGAHPCNAVALEKTEICLLPMEDLQRASQQVPKLLTEFTRIMSREILREEHVLMMLGTLNAEQRLASFLLNLAERMQKRGGNHDTVQLSMTRQDIGNYLGLAIETVSRNFSILQEQGLIAINKRVIEIRDRAALESMIQ